MIKKHVVVFVVNRKGMSVVPSKHAVTGRLAREAWRETDNVCEVA